jgi:hypothetical protein
VGNVLGKNLYVDNKQGHSYGKTIHPRKGIHCCGQNDKTNGIQDM